MDELVSIEVRSCQNQFDDVFLGVTHGDLTKKMDSNGDLTNQTGQPSKVGIETTNTGTLQNDIVIWGP